MRLMKCKQRGGAPIRPLWLSWCCQHILQGKRNQACSLIPSDSSFYLTTIVESAEKRLFPWRHLLVGRHRPSFLSDPGTKMKDVLRGVLGGGHTHIIMEVKKRQKWGGFNKRNEEAFLSSISFLKATACPTTLWVSGELSCRRFFTFSLPPSLLWPAHWFMVLIKEHSQPLNIQQ